MILLEKLDRPYEDVTIRTKVWYKCDYCGKEFQRDKKSRERLNKIVSKDSCGGKECKASKQKEVSFIQNGTDCIFKSEKFKKETEEKILEKFGTRQYFSSKDFQEKRAETMLSEYGTVSPLANPEIRAKQEKTMESTHGVKNYSQHEDFAEKVKQTHLERRGVPSAMLDPEVLEKRRQTSRENFGEDSYTKTDEYWENRKKNTLEKDGVEHTHQLPRVIAKMRQTCKERFDEDNYAKTEEFKKRYVEVCMEKLGVPNPLCLQGNQKYGKTQNEIKDWLNSLGFSFEKNYSILRDKEIDLYDPGVGIAIEYCGLFWHNEFSPQPRLQNYHYDKYVRCLDKGVRLITLFEDEWKKRQEQCENLILSTLGRFNTRVFARNCEIKDSTKSEFSTFCITHHLLGVSKLSMVQFALIYDNDVIGCISLGQHHRKQDCLVLDRLCFKSGHQIVGGASKLFDACKKWAISNGHSRIITWSDNRWSQGNVYPKMGFILEKELPPDYSYVNAAKPYQRISKQSQKKSNTGCPENLTEHEWAIENGLARIWDCGKKRWAFHLNT